MFQDHPWCDARQSDKLSPHARQVFAEPVLHLGQEDVGVVEPTVDQVDLLALEGVEPRSHVLGRHARRVARWIQHGYSGAVFRLRANACISLDHGDTSSRLWPRYASCLASVKRLSHRLSSSCQAGLAVAALATI